MCPASHTPLFQLRGGTRLARIGQDSGPVPKQGTALVLLGREKLPAAVDALAGKETA